MKLGLKRLVTTTAVVAITAGGLLFAAPANAATPGLGAQILKASGDSSVRVEVAYHTDKLILRPASKTQVSIYGQPSGIYTKYLLIEKNGKHTIYKKTLGWQRTLYFAAKIDTNRHYRTDKVLVKVTKKIVKNSTTKAKAFVKKTYGLPQSPTAVREYLLQSDVYSTVTDVQVALTDNPALDVTTVKAEKTAGYNGSVVITTLPADPTPTPAPTTDPTATTPVNDFQVTGSDTDDNYTFTYNSKTGEFTEGHVTQ